MAEATKRKSLGERMEELLSAINTLKKRQDDWEAAQQGGTPAEKADAAEELEAAEDKLETKASAAGMSEEDVARIADRVIAGIKAGDTPEEAAAAAGAPAEAAAAAPEGGGKTELENLAEGAAPSPEETTAPPPGEEAPPEGDDPPVKKHWTQRRVFGGGDDD